ncbi:MAG TPA: hypothetical protein EYP57_04695, partial [Thermodesulfobacteriaceae bacterium]|nr:hypothetical protein [Thermodesulfobacteriaceae bacterium]
MISSNSSIGQVNAASSEAPRYETVEERNALDREDFMTLFITQLQYQDPMKPLESAEMATQIAQFNMVDLLNRNNDAMEQLVASEAANAGMQALNFLGHEVRYSGNLLILTENGMKPFDVELDRPAAAGTVSIIDA